MARIGADVPLVAREAETARLTRLLERAEAGEAGALLVAGEAGVGKSRLLGELKSLATARGTEVYQGACLDADASLPNLPFTEIVGAAVAAHPALLDAYPGLARLLTGSGVALPPGVQPSGDREYAQLQLFEAVHAALAALAAERPVLLVVEDLHWADRSSLDLLVFVLSRLSGQRLAVAASLRSDELHRRHPLRPVLAQLARFPRVERLDLVPFDPPTALRFVRALVGDVVPEAVQRAVAQRSEGNAFLAEELLSASDAHSLPASLAEVLLVRLERLSPEAQQVLRLASVSGRRVGHARLRAASDLSDAQLDAALREAAAEYILVPDGDGYVFRHALLREAIYTDLMPGESARWHAAYAAAIVAEDDAPGKAAELAYHYAACHYTAGALAAYVKAAFEADCVGAPGDALEEVEHALTLWPAVPDPETVSGHDETSVYLLAAWSAGDSGDVERALRYSRVAMRLADAGDDVARAAMVRRNHVSYLLALPDSEAEAYALAKETYELTRSLPPSTDKALAEVVLARAAFAAEDFEGAREHAKCVLDSADAAAAEPGQGPTWLSIRADATVTYARTFQIAGDPRRALELLAEAVPQAAEGRWRWIELRARFNRAVVLNDLGDLTGTLSELRDGERRAADFGLTWAAEYGLQMRLFRMIIAFVAGEWQWADVEAETAGEAVPATMLGRLTATGLPLLVARGRWDAANRALRGLREHWPEEPQDVRQLCASGCELERARGRPEQAVRWIDDALTWMDRMPIGAQVPAIQLVALGVGAAADLAQQAARRHDEAGIAAARERADAMIARIDELLAWFATEGFALGPEAHAWDARVRAERTRLDGPGDVASWERVVAAFGYGEPYRQAEARVRLAESLVASGDRTRAETELTAALEVADRLAAVSLRDAVHGVARRARLTLAGDAPAAPAPASTGLLTEREQSVLTLVADGRTNRQVGEELFISEKTVSVHMTRVMAKLGATNRAEAVSLAYDKGLLETYR